MNKKLLLSSLLLATVIPFYSLTLVGCSKESSKKTPNELFNQIYKENINNNVIFDNQKAILVRNGWNNDTIDTNINLNYIDKWIKTNFNISENNYFRDNNSIKIVQDTFDQKFLKHLFNVDDIEEFFNSLNLNINEYLNIEFLLSIDKCYHDENEPQKFIYILTLQKILINGLKQDINNIGFAYSLKNVGATTFYFSNIITDGHSIDFFGIV